MPNDTERRGPSEAADEYLARILASRVDPHRLAVAAGVMRELAGADLQPLWSQVSIDQTGQPHLRTPDEAQAWATWITARQHVDRAIGWTVFLDNAAAEHARSSS